MLYHECWEVCCPVQCLHRREAVERLVYNALPYTEYSSTNGILYAFSTVHSIYCHGHVIQLKTTPMLPYTGFQASSSSGDRGETGTGATGAIYDGRAPL